MPRLSPVARPLVSLLVLLGLLCACTPSGGASERGAETAPRTLDPSVSMTDAGAERYAAVPAQESARPRYDLAAKADPESGKVDGTLTAVLPLQGADEATFRFFAGVPDLKANAAVGDITVDGEAVEHTLDASILTVPVAGDGEAGAHTLRIPFSYTLPLSEEPSPLSMLSGLGDQLAPSEIGLLSRHADSLALGHWFPLWIPAGRSADPVPDGYGDIGNFPAADVSLTVDVPHGWAAVESGVRTGEDDSDGGQRITSEGAGMRDYSVFLMRDAEQRTRELDGALAGVTISATAPADQADQLDGVLDETEAAVRTLSKAYGDYPWREFDVVSAPLGSSVGGMEWPGGTWIESAVFGGGIPGLGDLGDLGLGDLGLGDLLGELGGGLGGGSDVGLLLDTTRAWTLAHETAHTWWTIQVGNDSIADPVVDEPLAQYTACLVLREERPDDGDEVCQVQVDTGYEQLRQTGGTDAVADRATDEFASSLQYAGIIYGKAAAFYLKLEDRYGVDAVTSALRRLVAQHAFQTIDGAAVRQVLVDELGADAGALWDRWMEQKHGDADLGKPAESGGLGGPGGLDGLQGLDGLDGLGDLLGQLGGGSGKGSQSEDFGKLLEQLMKLLDSAADAGAPTSGAQA